jgi:hypothetical protein
MTTREARAPTRTFARVIGPWLIIVPGVIALRLSAMDELARGVVFMAAPNCTSAPLRRWMRYLLCDLSSVSWLRSGCISPIWIGLPSRRHPTRRNNGRWCASAYSVKVLGFVDAQDADPTFGNIDFVEAARLL